MPKELEFKPMDLFNWYYNEWINVKDRLKFEEVRAEGQATAKSVGVPLKVVWSIQCAGELNTFNKKINKKGGRRVKKEDYSGHILTSIYLLTLFGADIAGITTQEDYKDFSDIYTKELLNSLSLRAEEIQPLLDIKEWNRRQQYNRLIDNIFHRLKIDHDELVRIAKEDKSKLEEAMDCIISFGTDLIVLGTFAEF